MADSDKLTALKKAYAEIILNTAKEAAVRIMASEKEAQSYQRELFNAKDESLRMLMRLRQMLDSKEKEAEITSLNNQKRIEELEAQLGEVEDLVNDLRSELRELQDELEEQNLDKIDNHVTLSKESSCPEFSSFSAAHCGLVSTVETTNSASNAPCDGSNCCGENGSHKGSCLSCNPDVASIMIRSKESELYKNGCTQRIRAFGGELFGESLALSEEDNGGKKRKLVNEDGYSRKGWKCPNSPSYEEEMCMQSGSEEVSESDVEMVAASLVQSVARSMELSTGEVGITACREV